MRKLTFILLVCVLCPSLAGAWGLLPQCVTRGPNGENKPSCLGESFVTAGTVPCLEVTVNDLKKRSGAEGAALRSNLRESVQKAFDSWINTVRDTIKSSGREAEFADFLQSFPSAIEVRVQGAAALPDTEPEQKTKRRRKKDPVPPAPSRPVSTDKTCMNLTLKVGWERGYDARVCAEASAVDSVINWYTHYFDYNVGTRGRSLSKCHIKSDKLLPHEIGHLLGLADLYDNELEREAEDLVIVRDFSLLRMGIKSSTMEQFSIMTLADKLSRIGCDDVEAIINMADLMAVKRGTVSDRVKNGWKSFCPDYSSFRYAYGQPYRTADELEENKERIDAVLFFEQSYSKWNAEYNRLNAEIQTLNARVDTAPLPLKTANLMDSAKVNYLEDLRSKVRALANKLERQDPTKPILEEYKQLLGEEKKLNSFYDPAVLATYRPHPVHLEKAVAKQPHHCIKCGKLILPEDEGTATIRRHTVYFHSPQCLDGNNRLRIVPTQLNTYVKKYGYDRERKAAPALTYGELEAQALKESISLAMGNADVGDPLRKPTVSGAAGAAPLAGNTRVAKPAAQPAAHTSAKPAAKPVVKPTAGTSVKPAATPRVAKSAPKPVVQPAAHTSVKPAAQPAAKKSSDPLAVSVPKVKKCYICGQELSDGAFYAFAESKLVHKHNECAVRAFVQHNKTDEESLARYESFYFLNVPQDVEQAKADLRHLGITLADVRRYNNQTALLLEERQRQLQELSATLEKRQLASQKCSGYLVVTADDITRFETENSKALAAISKREKAGKKLTDKQKRFKRRLARMKADKVLTDYCRDAGL